MKKTIKPNFFVVGAAKSGTTSFYNYLNQHPNVYLTPIKEPHYFSKDIQIKNFNKEYQTSHQFDIKEYLSHEELEEKHIAFIDSLDSYLELFREYNNQKCIGEMSTGYLYSKKAAKEIYKFNSNAKIIIILRNPIERAFSHWIMSLQRGVENKHSFIDAVIHDHNLQKKEWGTSHIYIEQGLYYEQVKRYYDLFPSKNIKLFLFDDLKNDAKNVYRELFDFLEISQLNSEDFNKKYNVAKLPKYKIFALFLHNEHLKSLFSFLPKNIKTPLKNIFYSQKKLPKLTDSDRKALLPFFINDIKKLEQLIKRDLSGWYNHVN